LSDVVELEDFSGISSFAISNLGRDDINLTQIGVSLKVNIIFSTGSNRFGLTAPLNLNTLAFNHSAGWQYSRRF
jgi:predicted metal-dependent phosphotriesterase family hydrolase